MSQIGSNIVVLRWITQIRANNESYMFYKISYLVSKRKIAEKEVFLAQNHTSLL